MAGSGISACSGRFPFPERAGKTADSRKGKPTGRAGSCPAAAGKEGAENAGGMRQCWGLHRKAPGAGSLPGGKGCYFAGERRGRVVLLLEGLSPRPGRESPAPVSIPWPRPSSSGCPAAAAASTPLQRSEGSPGPRVGGLGLPHLRSVPLAQPSHGRRSAARGHFPATSMEATEPRRPGRGDTEWGERAAHAVTPLLGFLAAQKPFLPSHRMR